MDFGSEWEGQQIGIPYNVVGAGVPKVSVNFEDEDESDIGPYPIPANPLIEEGSDAHILIVDSSTCTLYELFAASYDDVSGEWSAGSGAIWQLNSNDLRPDEWTSADAAGLPILPGLVRYEEVLRGEINHAIRFTASRTNDYLWPARHLTSDNPTPEIPPMGARFRLKANYDISGFDPQLQVILRAMKTYGIILADNGRSWYVSGAPDARWNNDLLHDLDVLRGNNFEAVDTSGLMLDYDSGATPTPPGDNPMPPEETAKLIFIHHSTGQNWLADNHGNLGRALSQNNYFVSDTNYDWGPKVPGGEEEIGDFTDIPHWTEWFASANTPTYMAALFAESGQHSSYTRTLADPGGENEIIMFKSCFPNSNLAGNPNDPPDPSGWLTVGHAKYVYNQILQQYFAVHPEKFFVVITAPPVQDGTYATNARAFNQWLMNDWLDGYPLKNVFVFDFYNVLTGPGAHHRYSSGEIDYVQGNQNTLYYDWNGDDHPNAEGSQKATDEFVPLLNVFYHRWKNSSDTIPPTVISSMRLNGNPTNRDSVFFRVTFSEAITGVNAADFVLTTEGISGSSIAGVSGSGTTWTVTVNLGGGTGTLRLDVPEGATISDLAGNPLAGLPFTSGQEYSVTRSMWYVRGQGSFLYGMRTDLPVPADYNGDGKEEVAVYRPSNGTWYLKDIGPTKYGTPEDLPVPADYNGDGKDEMAVYRPSNGTWYIKGMGATVYGTPEDLPVPADYNGDGKDEIAVYRPSNGTWYIKGMGATVYGTPEDLPVPADYNGDGKAEIAVFRPSNGTWYIKSMGPTVYGIAEDLPLPADYNGDGKAEMAVFRRSNGTWYIKGMGATVYGTPGDLPVPADYNGDGMSDIAVFRP